MSEEKDDFPPMPPFPLRSIEDDKGRMVTVKAGDTKGYWEKLRAWAEEVFNRLSYEEQQEILKDRDERKKRR